MRKLFTALVVALAVLAGSLPASAARPARVLAALPPIDASSHLRILTMGDSITEGGTISGTGDAYRWELAQLIAFVGILPWSYVGDHTFGPHNFLTGAHSGWKLADVQAAAPAQIAAGDPDLVVLHAGINDARTGATAQQVADRLASALAVILGADPDLRVIVVDLQPPYSGVTQDQASAVAERANLLIPGVVAAAGPRVTLAKWSLLVNNDSLQDGLHPGIPGYQAMAYLVWTCMGRVLYPDGIGPNGHHRGTPRTRAELCPAVP